MLFTCCVLWQVLDGITDAPNIRNLIVSMSVDIRIRLSTAACWWWRPSLRTEGCRCPMFQCSKAPSCIPPRLAPARCPVPITPSSKVATHVSTQTSVIASCFHWDQARAWPWHSAWQVAVPQFPCVFKMPVKSAKQPMITAKRLWFHRSLRCGQLDLVTPARHLDSLVPGDEQCP